MVIFNFKKNELCEGEICVFIGDEIFCHLSETDFDIFYKMVLKSKNKIMLRV